MENNEFGFIKSTLPLINKKSFAKSNAIKSDLVVYLSLLFVSSAHGLRVLVADDLFINDLARDFQNNDVSLACKD